METISQHFTFNQNPNFSVHKEMIPIHLSSEGENGQCNKIIMFSNFLEMSGSACGPNIEMSASLINNLNNKNTNVLSRIIRLERVPRPRPPRRDPRRENIPANKFYISASRPRGPAWSPGSPGSPRPPHHRGR